MERPSDDAFDERAKRVIENWHGTVYVGTFSGEILDEEEIDTAIALEGLTAYLALKEAQASTK